MHDRLSNVVFSQVIVTDAEGNRMFEKDSKGDLNDTGKVIDTKIPSKGDTKRKSHKNKKNKEKQSALSSTENRKHKDNNKSNDKTSKKERNSSTTKGQVKNELSTEKVIFVIIDILDRFVILYINHNIFET